MTNLKCCAVALVLVGCSLPGGLCAQDWARKMFKELSHDFGSVAVGTNIQHRFLFQNIYKEDIHIGSVSSSCGCASAEVTKRVVKTWETAEIVATFNTQTFRGPKQATITVRINEPYAGEVQLQVQGNIRADLAFEPGSIEFGEVDENDAARKSIRVIHRGHPGWEIKDVKSTFNHIKVGLREAYRSGGTVQYDMIAELQNSAPPGFLQGELFIETNDGKNMHLPISFNAKVVPALQVSPEVLAFGPLSPGEEIVKKVFLKAKSPFRITDIETNDPCLNVIASDQANQLQVVEVTFRAGRDPGRHECQANIKTDLGEDTWTAIKAVATVEDQQVSQR